MTIHFTDLPKTDDMHLLPSGYWSGLVLFGVLWLAPVLTLVVLSWTK